jgi:hypothetical protein
MNLAGLQQLRSVKLSGAILLTDSSLGRMSGLRLPRVQHLSLKGVRLYAARGQQQAAAGSSGGSGSTQAPATGSSPEQQQLGLASMDDFVPHLCDAFPSLASLELGNAAMLSILGVAGLLCRLHALQLLRLVGCVPSLSPGYVPLSLNFTPLAVGSQQSQPQQLEGPGPLVGWVLPLSAGQHHGGSAAPAASSSAVRAPAAPKPGLPQQVQFLEDVVAFLQHGLLLQDHRGCTSAAAEEVADSEPPVPGALRLPLVMPASRLQNVELAATDGDVSRSTAALPRVLVRYGDRLLPYSRGKPGSVVIPPPGGLGF